MCIRGTAMEEKSASEIRSFIASVLSTGTGLDVGNKNPLVQNEMCKQKGQLEKGPQQHTLTYSYWYLSLLKMCGKQDPPGSGCQLRSTFRLKGDVICHLVLLSGYTEVRNLTLDLTSFSFLLSTSVFSELQINTTYWVEALGRLFQSHC